MSKLYEKIKTDDYEKLATLSAAYGVSKCVHYGQVDKGGVPYFEHVNHVADKFEDKHYKFMVVALLHDSVEDHPNRISIKCIAEVFGSQVADAVDAITKRIGEDYFEYIERVKENPIARAVKIEDLKHNLDVSRLPKDLENYTSLMKRYKDALAFLSK